MRNKIGQMKRLLILIALVLLSIAVIVTAENVVDDFTSEVAENVVEQITSDIQPADIQENIDSTTDAQNEEIFNPDIDKKVVETENSSIIEENLCKNINCEFSSTVCQDGFIVQCENSCILETGICNSCIPSCVGHEEVDEQNQTVNVTENTTVNETVSAELKDRIDVQLSHSTKATRGENLEISATVTNIGSEVENLDIFFVLPEGLDVIYNNGSCDNLGVGEKCVSVINIRTSEAKLGENKIKVEVNEK